MPSSQTLPFHTPDLISHLSVLDEDALDRLPFGVIGFDKQSDAIVACYNAFESRASGLDPYRVLGQPLFGVVAQHMNNSLVAQRFDDAVKSGQPMDVTVDFTFTQRMKAKPATLRLLSSPALDTQFIAALWEPRMNMGMVDIASEHQNLLEFLYKVPVGLVHASLDGDIVFINSVAAGWLMPLAAGAKLQNLFSVLAAVAPELPWCVQSHGRMAGVIVDNLRFENHGSRQHRESPEFVSMTLTKMADDRLMAVFTDVTVQVHDERVFKDSAEQYRAVVSVLNEGIVIHDPAGEPLLCNAAAERMIGTPLPAESARTALASGWAPLCPDGRPMHFQDTPTGIVLSGGTAQAHVAVSSIRGNGERRWLDVSAQAFVHPESGALLGVVTSFKDVTERELLQETLRNQAAHLLELVAQQTAMFDNDLVGIVKLRGQTAVWTNKGLERIFGYGPGELLSRPSRLLFTEDESYRAFQATAHSALQVAGRHRVQWQMCRKDGTPVWIDLSCFLLSEELGESMWMLADMTSMEQAESLRVRADELEADNRRIHEANRLKSQYVANVSHELRTALNGMMGMTSLALQRATDPTQLDWLNKAKRSANHLLFVINDVLDLSKIEADKMQLVQQELQLGGVLETLTDLISQRAAAKGLDFVAVIAPELANRLLVGDSQRLGQILLNLADNAVKFTDAGRVRVEVRVEQELVDGALVRFEVDDAGVGIAPEDISRLFQSFEQIGESSTRGYGGTGLGLAICKRMVDMMHGEIHVHSRLGQGSTFWFTAWLGAGQATHQQVTVPSPVDARKQLRDEFAESSILLVEDDPLNAEVMRGLLEDVAMQVIVAENGALAVTLARYGNYALILMDAQLPVLDGIQATRGIRQIPGLEHTPIIALTASAFVQDRTRCLDAGMSDHLAKPVDPAVLYSTLLKWLRSRPAMLQD